MPTNAAHQVFKSQLVELAPALRPRALRLTRDAVEAQDLIQETLLRALRFEASYAPGTHLKAWLHQVMFSVFVTRCRRLKRERRALDSLRTDPCAWTYKSAELPMAPLTRSLLGALDELPKQFAEAVRLVDLEDRSYKEAALLAQVPVGTVMSRLFRGRRLLASAISREENSEPATLAA